MLAAAVAAFAAGAHGTDAAWPSHPIRIVVAQAPGGPPDLIGRFVAERLARALGSPVVVDNRPGASGIIGVEQVARSAPDGHTLLIATMSTHVLVPLVSAKVPYDPVGDFVPVSNLFRTIKALWVNAALPPRTLREFVDYAAARPGQLNYATGGVGSSNHVDAAWFVQAAGLDLVHVPYNGPAAGIAAVAGGDAQMMVVSITTGLPLAQGGRVRPLAVFGDRRAALLPGVPDGRRAGHGRGRSRRVDRADGARGHAAGHRRATQCGGHAYPARARDRRMGRPAGHGNRRRFARRFCPDARARPAALGRVRRTHAHRPPLGTHGKPDLCRPSPRTEPSRPIRARCCWSR